MIQKKITILFFAILLFSFNNYAQSRSQFPVVISAFNTASELPGTGFLGVFTTPIHQNILTMTILVTNGFKQLIYLTFFINMLNMEFSYTLKLDIAIG